MVNFSVNNNNDNKMYKIYNVNENFCYSALT